MRVKTLFMITVALGLLAACGRSDDEQAPAAVATVATPAAAELVRYTARQFYETTSHVMASSRGHAFSSDGSSLLISSDQSGIYNAYTLSIATGEKEMLTQSATDAAIGRSYFPEDDRILFEADQGGNELNHVYVRELDGSVRDLTPGDMHRAMFASFSADGSRFFVYSNERNPQMFDLYAYDAATYERDLILQNEGFSPGPVAPDGSHVALIVSNSSADSDIYLAQTGTAAAPQLISEHEGNVAFSAYDFTPDGAALLYQTNEASEFAEAWRYELATGVKTPVLQADWDVVLATLSPSGRYFVSVINEDALPRLTITDTGSDQPVVLNGIPEGTIGGVRFNRDETMLAFTVASDTSPADIFVADLSTGQARRLTRSLNPAIDEAQLANAVVARFASYDGLEIPGILYRPREASAANPVPAIVMVHGGPGGQSGRGYGPDVQYLVNNGYAVYAINNRGSGGYGKTFFHMDDKQHGDADLRDVVAARDWLADMDWTSEQVVVMGGSYGGFMTAAAMAFYPQTFDLGINIFGVTNWLRTLESIPAWWGAEKVALYDEMGDPATDSERLRRISPLFHAANIERPMLVVQGANDPRVLQVESDELVAAVRANNVPVEYVVFADEGHGFLKKENRITNAETILQFLNNHLQ